MKEIKLVSDTIDKNDISDLVEWLTQPDIPRLTKGDLTLQFEKEFSNKIGTNHSIYVNSGSSAILLGLAALKYSNLLKNTKLVVSNLSWSTDVTTPVLLDYQTTLIDCNLEDLSVNLEQLEHVFKTQNPAAFILVSVLGLVPKMKEIINLCEKYDVILIEDVCESLGSTYQSRMLGSFGEMSFFSFYFGHHISTIEGGMICTSNSSLNDILLSMRSHGWDRDLNKESQLKWRDEWDIDDFRAQYTFYYPGMNLRSTDLQAFIGLNQIQKIDTFSKKRNLNFIKYRDLLLADNMLTLKEREGDFISSFCFPVINKNKSSIVKRLVENKIETRPLIAGSISKNPFWEQYSKKSTCLPTPNCNLIDEFGFYIPNHQDLTDEDIIRVVKIISADK
jgi:CDP-6-deoxy-D-xylo-4-hexulose-3-dehydrase|tara:strand:- start:7645 stop:8817 length:1173 start_codon:yes stop_codon:yes gene_type:complete